VFAVGVAVGVVFAAGLWLTVVGARRRIRLRRERRNPGKGQRQVASSASAADDGPDGVRRTVVTLAAAKSAAEG
jgi:uncharacterized membrane protein YciS (DUF1049 family)